MTPEREAQMRDKFETYARDKYPEWAFIKHSNGEYRSTSLQMDLETWLACARALEPKWVDAADQDPPEAKSVLVSGFEYGNPKYARTYGVAFYAEGVWVSDETGERIHTPTHWMPLPEQPKAAMSAALEDGNATE